MRASHKFFTYFGVLLFSSIVLSLPARGAERVALIVGNTDYPDTSVFGDIPMAQNDAKLVAATLKELGFTVISIENATKSVIYNRLLDFEKAIEKGGTALFYYAGHGIEFEKKNYLIGTNALFHDRDLLGAETIDADIIINKMLRANPKTALVFLDCCREPPSASWLTSYKKARIAGTLGLAPVTTRPGLIVGFAASAGNLANDRLDEKAENGPYALALTKHMKAGEELSNVIKYTGRDVNSLSIQMKQKLPGEPIYVQEPAVYGQIYHDFYFTRKVVPNSTTQMPSTGPNSQTSPPAPAFQEAPFQRVEIADKESAFFSEAWLLTREGKRSGEGYFSADGKKMVFQSEREEANPFYQIYLLDLKTGGTERISPGHGKTSCGWVSPDGKKVMFASTQMDEESTKKQAEEIELRESGKPRRYSWDYDPEFEVLEYHLASGEYKNLTNTLGYDAEGAYSPDGKSIVFASNRQAYDGSMSENDQKFFKLDQKFAMEIYTADADGGNVKRLTNADGQDGGPFFSWDGKKICWRRFDRKGTNAEIFTMNADGSDQKQITKIGAMAWAPMFHPSGKYLIFATNIHGFANFELYLVRADGVGNQSV